MLIARPEVLRYALGLMAAVLAGLLLFAGALALIAWLFAPGAPAVALPLGLGLSTIALVLALVARRAMKPAADSSD